MLTSLQLTGQNNQVVLIVYWYMWLLGFSAVGDQLRSIPIFNWPLVTAPHSLIGRSRHVSCGPGWGALGNIQWVPSYPSWARLQSQSIVHQPPRWLSSIVEYHPTVSSGGQYPSRSVVHLYWHSDVSQHLSICCGLPSHGRLMSKTLFRPILLIQVLVLDSRSLEHRHSWRSAA